MKWNRKMIAAILPLSLALTGCFGGSREEQMPESGVARPEGLFIFSSLSGNDIFNSNYGLIDAEGRVALPLQYDSINIVSPMEYDYEAPPVPADERFFQVNVYDPDEEKSSMQTRSALCSPQGKLLTDFLYYYLAKIDESSFAALSSLDPPVCVLLDREGQEHPIADEALAAELTTLAKHYSNMDYYYELGQNKYGPDVPEGGFAWVQELGDGSYWGNYMKPLHQDTAADSKGNEINNQVMDLFDEGGNRIGKYSYSSVSKLSDEIWVGSFETYDDATETLSQQCQLMTPRGEPLLEERYDQMWNYNTRPYFVASLGDELIVLYCDTLEEHLRLPWNPALHGAVHKNGGKQYFSTESGDAGDPPVIYDLETGESLEFPLFPGAYISDVLRGGTRFLLYCESAMAPKPEARAVAESDYHFLVDNAGNPVVGYNYNLFVQKGYIVASQTYRVTENRTYVLNGLLDLDGNQLLPYEFSSLTVLDGNAVHVVRGDEEGIMDFAGNWIYKQSVYQGMEE